MSENLIIDGDGNIVGKSPVDQVALTKMTDGFLSVASSYIVDSDDMRAIAYSDVTVWKRAKKDLDEKRLSLTRPLDNVKAGIMALFRTPTEKLDEAISIVNSRILNYDEAQRKKAAEEQARINAEARRKREAEEAIAAAERQAAEDILAKAEAERRAAEAAEAAKVKAAQDEQERLKRLAAETAKSGDLEESRAIEAEARRKQAEQDEERRIAAERQAEIDRVASEEAFKIQQQAQARQLESALAVIQVVAKVETKGARSTWKGKCTDKMKLIQFIVANPAYANLVVVDESALNAMAKAQKAAMQIDGCMAYEQHSVAAARS